jgi:hypothetical protein
MALHTIPPLMLDSFRLSTTLHVCAAITFVALPLRAQTIDDGRWSGPANC